MSCQSDCGDRKDKAWIAFTKMQCALSKSGLNWNGNQGMIMLSALRSLVQENEDQKDPKIENESLWDENEKLRAWIDDLQSGMYINCVYCGHRYGPEKKVAPTMQQALYDHIKVCPKHPCSLLKKALDISQYMIDKDKALSSWFEDEDIERLDAGFAKEIPSNRRTFGKVIYLLVNRAEGKLSGKDSSE